MPSPGRCSRPPWEPDTAPRLEPMSVRPPATSPPPTDDGLALARRVLETEAAAILGLVATLDHRFERVVELLLGCRGRVIVTGIGKSGIICRKVAATLGSTGTPAFFLHPAEAVHGDLGVIHAADVVIALSHSGETPEVLRVIEAIKRIGATLVALTGHARSTLGQTSDVVLDTHVDEEACPFNLAPTASTTAALALGDALAMTLLVRKGFREEDFASLHPGGRLGRRLMRVEQAMHAGDAAPLVRESTLMPEIFHEMSSKRLGMTCVVDHDGRLTGGFTEADLRRLVTRPAEFLTLTADQVMTRSPLTIDRRLLAVEALKIMEARKVTSGVVVERERRVEGVVHLHDLWRTQMV